MSLVLNSGRIASWHNATMGALFWKPGTDTSSLPSGASLESVPVFSEKKEQKDQPGVR